MNKQCLSFSIAVAIVIAGVSAAPAEESAWKLPNLNPFASKAQPPTAARAPKSGGGSLPRIWPKSSATKRPTGQPTALDKMTRGTKQFFSKTADALNPWDDEKERSAPRASGSNSAISRATKKKTESSGSGLLPASWWSSDEKDPRDKTVNDFLARPRPGQ